MKFRKQRHMESLAKAPTLRAIRTPYSVRYHVFNPNINEQLCSISRQSDFNLITIKYGRLKYWLRKGLSFHRSNFLETEQILWPKGLTPLANSIHSKMLPLQNPALNTTKPYRSFSQKVISRAKKNSKKSKQAYYKP